jgi:hypothetical protein
MHRVRYLLRESFELPSNITVDQDCGWGDQAWSHLHEFCSWCQQNLQLPSIPRIRIVATREGGMTTGAYDPQSDVILVYGRERALVDVLRTLAHELTHFRQRLQDRIKSTQRDWDLEGEADAEAGKMVYTYAHADPKNMMVYEL